MKIKSFLTSSGILLTVLFSCADPAPKTLKENDGSVRQEVIAGDTLTICKFDASKDTINLPLSEIVEDCRIVRFENSEKAFFKAWFITVSDNYIGIRQEDATYKLFDKNGKYLHDVGAWGNGPGEYSSTLYDDIIDEEGGRIFFTPFTGKKIMVYGIDGKWIKDIELPGSINKAKLSLNPDGTLSVLQMPFSEGEPFAFQVDMDGNILKNIPATSNMKASSYDSEIFAFRNNGNFDFFYTGVDTVFRYDPATNQLLPRFTMDFSSLNERPFHVYNGELPNHFITNYYYWNENQFIPGGEILIDKKKQSSAHFNMLNDFYGNLPINSPTFRFFKGRFILNMEPGELKENIEQHLASGKCPDKDKKKLQDLAASLNENDNNLLFTGKLK